MHEKKYFSVADTNKGYWHVELDEESSLLCTFNTPFGRYRFKRLPFGVSVSQDIFQRRLHEVYKDIPYVTGIVDDIIIAGSMQQCRPQFNKASIQAKKRQFLWTYHNTRRNPAIQRQTGGNKEHSNPNRRKRPTHHTRNNHLPQPILNKASTTNITH